MQGNLYLVVAQGLDWTLNLNLTAVNCQTLLGSSFSDLTGGNRTEQSAGLSRGNLNNYGGGVQLVPQCLCSLKGSYLAGAASAADILSGVKSACSMRM